MSKCIFRSGFVWKIVEYQWPNFEQAFANFNPKAGANFADEKLDELTQDASGTWQKSKQSGKTPCLF